jgi:hypothetical protein
MSERLPKTPNSNFPITDAKACKSAAVAVPDLLATAQFAGKETGLFLPLPH